MNVVNLLSKSVDRVCIRISSNQLTALLFFLIFPLLALAQVSLKNAPRIPFTQIDETHGLISGMVYEIASDKWGRICGATNTGVFCFDGKSVSNFTPSNGLSVNEILRIKADSTLGMLLLGFSGSLDVLQADSIVNLVKSAQIQDFSIDVTQVNQQFFLATRGSGVFRSEGSAWEKWATGRFQNLTAIDNGLASINQNGSINRINQGNFFSDRFQTPDSRTFVLNETWSIFSENATVLIKHLTSGDAFTYDLPFKPSLLYASENRLFVAVEAQIFVFNLQKDRLIPEGQINASHPISSLLVDVEKGLWASTLGGGIVWVPNVQAGFVPFDNAVLIAGTSAKTFVTSAVGDVLIIEPDRKVQKKLPFKVQPSASNSIKRTRIFDETAFWITDRQVLVTDLNLHRKFEIRTLVKDVFLKKKTIFLATILGLVVIPLEELKRFETKSRVELAGMLESNISFTGRIDFVEVLPREQYLVASGNVLSLLDASFSTVSTDTLKGRVSSVACSIDSTVVYITTMGAGVFKKELATGQVIQVVTESIATKVVMSDKNRPQWIQDRLVWDETGLVAAEAEGLLSRDVNDHVVKSGQRYVATREGVFVLPDAPRTLAEPRIVVDNKPSGARLNWKEPVKFNPKIVHLLSAGRRSLQFRLSSEMDWQTVPETPLQFDLLADGRYNPEFKIVLDGRNVAFNQKLASFTIAPPWWRTRLTLFLATVTGLVLLYLIMRRIIFRIQERANLNKKVFDLTLMNLRAQLKPHFIFNALNAVRHLVMSDQRDAAVRYLTTFSKVLRAALQHNEAFTVSLDQELAFSEQYLELEQLRLGDNFKFTRSTAAGLVPENVQIPAFILQPLLENAIWHGLQKQKAGIRSIRIEIEKDDLFLIIKIIDSGPGFDEKHIQKSDSKGLSLVDTKLSLFQQNSGRKAWRITRTNSSGEFETCIWVQMNK